MRRTPKVFRFPRPAGPWCFAYKTRDGARQRKTCSRAAKETGLPQPTDYVEAGAVAKAYLARLSDSSPGKGKETLLSVAVETVVQRQRARVAPSTLCMFEAAVREFRAFLPGRVTKTGQVTAALLADFKTAVFSAPGRRPGSRREASSANIVLLRLSPLFTAGDDYRWWTFTPDERRAALREERVRKPVPVILTPEETQVFLTAAQRRGPDSFLFCLLCACYGLRAGECAALTWADVNPVTGYLTVRDTERHHVKTRTERQVPLSLAPATTALLSRLKAWRTGPLFAVKKHHRELVPGARAVKPLRSTWVSVQVAIRGVDAARDVAALAGHHVSVSERHYIAPAAFAVGKANVEEALELSEIISRETLTAAATA